jgi:hypothetical protein
MSWWVPAWQCKANTYELVVKTFAGEGRGGSPPILADTELQQLTAARAKQLGGSSLYLYMTRIFILRALDILCFIARCFFVGIYSSLLHR